MTRFNSTAIAAAVGLAVLAGCARNAPPAPDTAVEEAALRANTVAWVEAYNAGDADKIVAMYADDGALMPPEAPTAVGHDAMRQYLVADIAASKAAGMSFALDQDASGVSGDLGWHTGAFHVANSSGATVVTGKYAEIWRKLNGKWLMIRDIWNNDAPAAAAAPAAALAQPKQ